jgi:glycyl-tRNA synthetase (class II)
MQDHEKFQSVAEEEPLLFSRELQMGEEKRALPMKLGEAVAEGIIANQTLAYFIGRTFTFLKRVGLNPEVRPHSKSPAIVCSSCAVADGTTPSDLDNVLEQHMFAAVVM